MGTASAKASAPVKAPPVAKKAAKKQEQWWNPFSWSANTWQDVGAMAAGALVTAGVVAAVLGTAACAAVTFGVCAAVVVGVAITAGAVVTYNLQSGPKSPEGMAQAVGWSLVAGAVGGAAAPIIGRIVGAVAPKVVSGVAARAASEASANAGAKSAEDAAGIAYQRTDLMGGKSYVGQAKSQARYTARQAEHARANPDADFEFEILGRAEPGGQLDRMEEFFIRRGGGSTNLSNPDGGLANLRHQMSDLRYLKAGGDPW